MSKDVDIALRTASSFVFMNVEDPHSFIVSLVHFHLTFGCTKIIGISANSDWCKCIILLVVISEGSVRVSD